MPTRRTEHMALGWLMSPFGNDPAAWLHGAGRPLAVRPGLRAW